MEMKNLVIKSGDLSLRELEDDDTPAIIEIIRSCAIYSTAKICIEYILNQEFQEKMQEISKREQANTE